MNNFAKFYFTEEELLEKVGFNKDTSVISKIEFNQEYGDIEITVRSSEEVKGVTGKTGNVRRNKLFKDGFRYYDEEKQKWEPINITINTYGCEDKSPKEFAEKFIKAIKEKGNL